MNLAMTVYPEQLFDVLLAVAPVRPVFLWGAPGIGKSSLVNQFAKAVGLDCVSLLGSQLAPEDILGVPQIVDDCSVFRPPRMIARKEPYCLFLDELNACSQEVQKAFYSLILDRRIGEYELPEGSIVIGAGNRAQDGAIVKNMSSALVNRMFHVQLGVAHRQWLTWAYEHDIHSFITEYISQRPDQLFSEPPKVEEPYSTPRSWHMLSDAIKACGDSVSAETLKLLAYGCISPAHAGMFVAFTKQTSNKYLLVDIIKGTAKWPDKPDERDVLYFLAQSFRSQLIKELPVSKQEMNSQTSYLIHRAKKLIKDLAGISLEIAQMVVSGEDEKTLPDWFMVEIVRDLPRLVTNEVR